MQNLCSDENHFMGEAFLLAEQALNTVLEKREVPVGCVFVFDQEIIAKSHNSVNQTGNATRHAELNCIDQVVRYCKDKQLQWSEIFPKIAIYVTVEPCIMCLSILLKLKVDRIYYGCSNDRFGGKTVLDVTQIMSSNSNTKILGGFQSEQSMDLLKQFYKGANPKVPESKRKKRV